MYFKNIAKFLLVTAAVFAVAPNTGLALSFDIKTNPANPAPNETVFLSVSALEFNMDLSNISWTVDGKPKDSGIGKKSISVTAPANGKSMTILVKIVPNIGGALENSITISPSDVDIIWEAVDSYVPPFYRGKALPLKQSEVKVVAVPNIKSSTGVLKPASSFVYTWKKDGKNFPASGGYGKSSFSFVNQILDKQNRIEVSLTDGTKSANGAFSFLPYEPEILFYENDQLKGPQYQKSFKDGDIFTDKARLSVLAEPYFLSKNFKSNNNIKGVWKLNGREFSSKIKNGLVINTRETTGLINVYFSYEDKEKLFRNFNKSIGINLR